MLLNHRFNTLYVYKALFFCWFERNPMMHECFTWYPMVLDRHHSRRICLILLALDTPKLWERFSFGLESTGLGRLSWEDQRKRFSLWWIFQSMKKRLHKHADDSITCSSQSPTSQKWTCEPGLQCFEVKSGTSQAPVCAQYLYQRIHLLTYPRSWYKEKKMAQKHFSSVQYLLFGNTSW